MRGFTASSLARTRSDGLVRRVPEPSATRRGPAARVSALGAGPSSDCTAGWRNTANGGSAGILGSARPVPWPPALYKQYARFPRYWEDCGASVYAAAPRALGQARAQAGPFGVFMSPPRGRDQVSAQGQDRRMTANRADRCKILAAVVPARFSGHGPPHPAGTSPVGRPGPITEPPKPLPASARDEVTDDKPLDHPIRLRRGSRNPLRGRRPHDRRARGADREVERDLATTHGAYDEMIAPGAFARTIAQRAGKIPLPALHARSAEAPARPGPSRSPKTDDGLRIEALRLQDPGGRRGPRARPRRRARWPVDRVLADPTRVVHGREARAPIARSRCTKSRRDDARVQGGADRRPPLELRP